MYSYLVNGICTDKNEETDGFRITVHAKSKEAAEDRAINLVEAAGFTDVLPENTECKGKLPPTS